MQPTCHLRKDIGTRFFKGDLIVDNSAKGTFLLNPDTTRTQYGALCWRMMRGKLQVLLVTSRDTGRWVIPKGWPIDGLTPEASAAREAWEEAGVKGRVTPECVGLFAYDKVISPDLAVPCVVAVYPIQVSRLSDTFPERKERRRKWFAADKAGRKVNESELGAILATFRVPPAKPASLSGPGAPGA